ncbi:unnamed protein product [Linum tenue]|uniref:Uncharacterized protein n=1 Tax=Linum tenue TaxID=586396 RepID=A0AAV0I3J4_9ROSI|nr:unnamed protein product [Linum tenue]
MASKGKGQKGIDEFYYEDEEKKEPCDYFEWHDIRAALYKERKRLSELVSNLQLENADLRAALDRVSKHSVDVGIESKNVISSYEEIVVAIKSIKLRLDQLEAGSSKLK